MSPLLTTKMHSKGFCARRDLYIESESVQSMTGTWVCYVNPHLSLHSLTQPGLAIDIALHSDRGPSSHNQYTSAQKNTRSSAGSTSRHCTQHDPSSTLDKNQRTRRMQNGQKMKSTFLGFFNVITAQSRGNRREHFL